MSRNKYINGNYIVYQLSDGTRIKEALSLKDTEFKPTFPDSIDIKLTNNCKIGCPYCHESSVPGGSSFDLEYFKRVIQTIPPGAGIELAFGGGDLLEIKEEVMKLLDWISSSNMCVNPRFTINAKSLIREKKDLPEFLYKYPLPLGISIENYQEFEKVNDLNFMINVDNVVYHIIVGVFDLQSFKDLIKDKDTGKVLVLGYKNFGRGSTWGKENFSGWSEEIKRVLGLIRLGQYSNTTLGFDNLAIEQLGLKDFLLPSEWETFYQGDEFTGSMYFDVVNKEFAPTSRSKFRWKTSSFGDSIIEFFNDTKVKEQFRQSGEE